MMQKDNTMSTATLSSLLESTVHVLGDMNADGSNVRIQNGRANFGTPSTPFFSCQQELLQSVDVGQSVLSMSAKELFKLMPSTQFVLNPRSIDPQEFSPEFIRQLLDGSYFVAAATPVQQGAQTMASRFKSMFSLR